MNSSQECAAEWIKLTSKDHIYIYFKFITLLKRQTSRDGELIDVYQGLGIVKAYLICMQSTSCKMLG